jgi:carbonic anhydrase
MTKNLFTFVAAVLLLGAATLIMSFHGPSSAGQALVPAAADVASGATPLERLMAGNQRFVDGAALNIDRDDARRAELVAGQEPFAVIVSCSDSRVPPELVFDQGLGQLFVVRLAGNIIDPAAAGSVEYAMDHLHVHLVVVLGHDQCGAVKAAIQGGQFSPELQAVIDQITPAVQKAKTMNGDLLENTINVNAEQQADKLSELPAFKHELDLGQLQIVAARYDLPSGKVDVLGTIPAQ